MRSVLGDLAERIASGHRPELHVSIPGLLQGADCILHEVSAAKNGPTTLASPPHTDALYGMATEPSGKTASAGALVRQGRRELDWLGEQELERVK